MAWPLPDHIISLHAAAAPKWRRIAPCGQWNSYLSAGGQLVGMHTQHSTTGASMLYFHTDRLGSISTITNANGAVVERLSAACPGH